MLSAATPSVRAGGVTGIVHFYGYVATFLNAPEVPIEAAKAQSHYRNDSWNAVVLAVANEQARPLYRLVRNTQVRDFQWAGLQNGTSSLNP